MFLFWKYSPLYPDPPYANRATFVRTARGSSVVLLATQSRWAVRKETASVVLPSEVCALTRLAECSTQPLNRMVTHSLEQIFRTLNEAGARYLVVGGLASALIPACEYLLAEIVLARAFALATDEATFTCPERNLEHEAAVIRKSKMVGAALYVTVLAAMVLVVFL